MDILRTPDERFAGLPGYGFQPHYVNLKTSHGLDVRIHYLDEGLRSGDAPVFLCLHGQPTWCYLYRKMIPVFTASGARVVAPDLMGFGRSDKPANESVYTFSSHREILISFIRALDLNNITLTVQDWGGLLGLTLPMDMPERVMRLFIMNTALSTGERPLGAGFYAWRDYSNSHPDMDVARLVQRSTSILSDAEAMAYAAPFPDARYKAGVRRFVNLVPDSPDADGAAISRKARDYLSTQWRGASFMAIGMQDPVIGEKPMKALAKIIRNCPPPLELPEAGHFVQEWGEAPARAALESFNGSNSG
jgi:haloalkane dehalogenase/tRNA(adenine34) deaminase